MSKAVRRFFGVFILFLFSCNSSVFTARRRVFTDVQLHSLEQVKKFTETLRGGSLLVCPSPRWSNSKVLTTLASLAITGGGLTFLHIYITKLEFKAAIKYAEGAEPEGELSLLVERYFEVENDIQDKEKALKALKKIDVKPKVEEVTLALRELKKEKKSVESALLKIFRKEVPLRQQAKLTWKEIRGPKEKPAID